MSNEFNAQISYYWSKVRQALKKGSLIEAAEWLESAGAAANSFGPGKSVAMVKELTDRVGKLCRGEIVR